MKRPLVNCARVDIRAIDRAVQALIDSVGYGDPQQTYAAYKTLRESGAAAIPALSDAIRLIVRQTKNSSVLSDCLSALLSVLSEIDNASFRSIVNELRGASSVSFFLPMLESAVRSIGESYTEYMIHGIRVLEAKSLEAQRIRRHLERWLRTVPNEDLAGINLIKIVSGEQIERLGSYLPTLCNIQIRWFNTHSRLNPMSYLNLNIIRNVMYHEIGHHVFRHSFCESKADEKQASDYADYLMARSDDPVFRVIRTIFGNPRKPHQKPDRQEIDCGESSGLESHKILRRRNDGVINGARREHQKSRRRRPSR